MQDADFQSPGAVGLSQTDCLTATKEELEQRESRVKSKLPGKISIRQREAWKGQRQRCTEPGAGGQLWKIDAEGTVRQVRGNEERAGAGTAG